MTRIVARSTSSMIAGAARPLNLLPGNPMMTTAPQPRAVLIFFTRVIYDLPTRGRREYPDARHGLPCPIQLSVAAHNASWRGRPSPRNDERYAMSVEQSARPRTGGGVFESVPPHDWSCGTVA